MTNIELLGTLGEVGTDTVTGFPGFVTAVIVYLGEDVPQVQLTAPHNPSDASAKPGTYWIPVTRLELLPS